MTLQFKRSTLIKSAMDIYGIPFEQDVDEIYEIDIQCIGNIISIDI